MSITAKLNTPAIEKDVSFGRTLIDWNNQTLTFQIAEGKNYVHKLTQGEWNYLVSGLESLMNNIPNISDVIIPDFDPDME